MKHILVTGGAGYIGSHTCLRLLEENYEVIVVDNFCNSKPESLERVKQITGKSLVLYEANICDREAMQKIFKTHSIDAVIHFAGLKAVGESVEKPMEYYNNNVYGTLILCEVMADAGVKNIVFSSSATVYGLSDKVPFTEDMPTSATNPYGRTKLFIEKILSDIKTADQNWSVTLLRYFNPVGAHQSGLIGEDPNDIPNNLMPYISQVAVGRLKQLQVLGNDYPTIDGTGVRDYIHVMDLAEGHVKALQGPQEKDTPAIYNLGTGRGNSVLEVIRTFEEVNKISIPYRVVSRRTGDVAISYANVSKAEKYLKWKTQLSLQDMVRDAWNWQKKNPEGYA
ncbi:MAG: UDP-glucose 4-epimerase GalE [Candidatus Neomarinimicrobiota bacterium]|nr:MAG: UDP-glucose 4-epimerase GalE [Candidatus Neomarinimicrobiota bacterium]